MTHDPNKQMSKASSEADGHSKLIVQEREHQDKREETQYESVKVKPEAKVCHLTSDKSQTDD